MQNSIPDFLKIIYSVLCCGIFLLGCTALVMITRRSSLSREWTPLIPIVNGTLESKHRDATLQGTYGTHPVRVRSISGGAEDPDTFLIEMTTVPQGADWSLEYGSEKLFGRDQWYVKSKDEALQSRLTESGLVAEMQNWPSHSRVEYKMRSGTLIYEEKGPVPRPERFRAQLDLLLHLAQLNQQLNTGTDVAS